MSHSKSYEFLLKDISTLKRVGEKTKKLLKKKKIESLFDVLWHLPHAFVDRSNLININKLEPDDIKNKHCGCVKLLKNIIKSPYNNSSERWLSG